MKERTNNGRFAPGNTVRRGKTKKKPGTVTNIASTTRRNQKGIVLHDQVNKRYSNREYYQDGMSGNLAYELAIINTNTPIHGGIYNRKVELCTGSKIMTSDDKIDSIIKDVDGNGTGLIDLYQKVNLNKFGIGRAFIEVVTNASGQFVNLYNIDATDVKIGKGEYEGLAIIKDNWLENKRIDNDTLKIPFYPNYIEIDGNQHSIIQINDAIYPGYKKYGLPKWIGAFYDAMIDQKLSEWNYAKINNSHGRSGIYEGTFADPEQAKEAEEIFNRNRPIDEKVGYVMMLMKEPGGDSGTFTDISGSNDGDWSTQKEKTIDNLVTAWSVPRSLSGISESTGFDTKRILNDYEYYKNSTILSEQESFLNVIDKIYNDILGISIIEDVAFKNENPVSIINVMNNLETVFKIWELRKEMGLDYDPEDEYQQEYVKNANNNTTNQRFNS